MNTTLINFLLKLKNASLMKKHIIVVTFNKTILDFSKLFYTEGLIQGFLLNSNKTNITIFLHYFANSFAPFQNLKLISTVSNIQELKYLDICKLSTQQRLFFFSTTKGIITSNSCKQNGIGGKLLFVC